MKAFLSAFLITSFFAVNAMYQSYLPEKNWKDCPDADTIYSLMLEIEDVVKQKDIYVTQVAEPNNKILKDFRSELNLAYEAALKWDTDSNHLQEHIKNKEANEELELQRGFVDAEFWKISGKYITDFTKNAKYPDIPDEASTLQSLQGPIDWYSSYGQRIRGYLIPKVNGKYTFWIASDDESELYLSTSGNPADKKQIAYLRKQTSVGNFNAALSQKSKEIYLIAEQPYYIEVLHKDAGESDHVEVAWKGPGIEQQIISGDYLAGYFVNKKTVEAQNDLSSHDKLRSIKSSLASEEATQDLFSAIESLNDNCNSEECLSSYELLINTCNQLIDCYEKELSNLPSLTNQTYVDTMKTLTEDLKYSIDQCEGKVCPDKADSSFNYLKSCQEECKDSPMESEFTGDTTCTSGLRCYHETGIGTIRAEDQGEVYVYALYSLLQPNYYSYEDESTNTREKIISLPYGNFYVYPTSKNRLGMFVYELEGVTLEIGSVNDQWNELWVIFDSKTYNLTVQLNDKRKYENVTEWDKNGKGLIINMEPRPNQYTFYGNLPFCYQNKIIYSEDGIPEDFPDIPTPEPQPNNSCYSTYSSSAQLQMESINCTNVTVTPTGDPTPSNDQLCLNETQSVAYEVLPYFLSDYTFYITFGFDILGDSQVVLLPDKVQLIVEQEESGQNYQVIISNSEENYVVGNLDKTQWNSVLIFYNLDTVTYQVTLNKDQTIAVKFQNNVRSQDKTFILKGSNICYKTFLYTPYVINDTTLPSDEPTKPYDPEPSPGQCKQLSQCKNEMIGDGLCQPECLIKECEYDRGDCLTPNSTHCAPDCQRNFIGDRICQDACNNAACNYDCQDCMYPNENLCFERCTWGMINNGECESECNNALCDFDGFDCRYPNLNKCNEECYWRQVGDSYCDQQCNTLDCQYDGGDCVYPNQYYCAEGCLWDWLNDGICEPECQNSDCQNDLPDCSEECQVECSSGCCYTQLGDGMCQSECNNAECFYDQEDCTTCSKECTWSSVGDGKCDQQCNIDTCQFDGGDCDRPPIAHPCGDTCNQGTIGDGICNLECNTEECDFDKGDCIFPNNNFCWLGCQKSQVNNDICEPPCQVEQCDFDGQDCTPSKETAIFQEDFESGNLNKWVGKEESLTSGTLTHDPLNSDNTVLTFTSENIDGDIFTPLLESPTGSYVVCFNYLAMSKENSDVENIGGSVGVGNEEEIV